MTVRERNQCHVNYGSVHNSMYVLQPIGMFRCDDPADGGGRRGEDAAIVGQQSPSAGFSTPLTMSKSTQDQARPKVNLSWASL